MTLESVCGSIILERVPPIDGSPVYVNLANIVASLVLRTLGGYFCVLLLSLPSVYPIPKQDKPKLITAMKSIILMAQPSFPVGILYGESLCSRRVTKSLREEGTNRLP